MAYPLTPQLEVGRNSHASIPSNESRDIEGIDSFNRRMVHTNMLFFAGLYERYPSQGSNPWSGSRQMLYISFEVEMPIQTSQPTLLFANHEESNTRSSYHANYKPWFRHNLRLCLKSMPLWTISLKHCSVRIWLSSFDTKSSEKACKLIGDASSSCTRILFWKQPPT